MSDNVVIFDRCDLSPSISSEVEAFKGKDQAFVRTDFSTRTSTSLLIL